MNFVPNLQMMAYVQIAIPILNNSEIRHLIDSYTPNPSAFPLLSHEWEEKNVRVCNLIEKSAMEKISTLVLPSSMKSMIKDCIMYMFSRILECKKIYSLILTKGTNYVNQHFKYVWKYDGTIDQKNTVKSLIENEDLNIKERFVLASTFSESEYNICSLWKRMMQAGIFFTPIELECRPLVKLWIQIIEEGSPSMEIPESILESFDVVNNISMLRIIKEKLPLEMQRLCLFNASRKSFNTDVMIFCLSQMEKNDQETVFKNYPTNVLKSMLTWAFQPMFLNVADHLWAHLSEERFCDFLRFIILKIMQQEWTDFRIIQLLKEFWFESPVHLKEYAKRKSFFKLLEKVLNSDWHYIPRSELQSAYIEIINEILQNLGCILY